MTSHRLRTGRPSTQVKEPSAFRSEAPSHPGLKKKFQKASNLSMDGSEAKSPPAAWQCCRAFAQLCEEVVKTPPSGRGGRMNME